MDIFCERLKELRTERNMTLMELAEATGLTRSALSTWENGTRIPSALAIIALAKYFNVSSDYLLGLTDDE